MKLYISLNSPYVRMVRVLLEETGRAFEVEQVEVNPRDPSSGYWALNPTSRVPALELPNGTVIPESSLICAYLDKQLADGRFFAPLHADPQRLGMFGTAVAMLDRGVAARTEKMREGGPDHETFINTQLAAVIRAADAFEKFAAPKTGEIDMLDIAIACATAWVDFRHPEVKILEGRGRLSEWVQSTSARPSMLVTRPH